jgi:hypothetical protein
MAQDYVILIQLVRFYFFFTFYASASNCTTVTLMNINNVFSNALSKVDEPSYIDNDYINIEALKSRRVSDPNHGSAQAIQASEGNVKEQWADIFANLVVGNIDTTFNRSGSAMYNFAINALFPKNATIRQ